MNQRPLRSLHIACIMKQARLQNTRRWPYKGFCHVLVHPKVHGDGMESHRDDDPYEANVNKK